MAVLIYPNSFSSDYPVSNLLIIRLFDKNKTSSVIVRYCLNLYI